MEDWEGMLTTNPKILWGLVADVVKAAKAAEGERRTGRRPSASVASLDELYEVLFPPAYSTEAFPVALHYVMGKRSLSQRALARIAGCDQATISRLLSGRTPATPEIIELLSHHLQVHPTFFSEYRALKLGQLVTSVFMADPEVSVESCRNLFLAGAPA